jgi:co-chaperonin GroES (HSP10)
MDVAEYVALEEKEQLIDKLTQEIYKAHRGFVPKFPWVFVRTLNKEQQIGHIICPEKDQNKVTHEGIVLAVWPSFVKQEYRNGNYIQTPMQSELKPGDHVLFPHWAGLPVGREYKDTRYRIVREIDWAPDQGGIFAVVKYADEDSRAMKVLEDMLRMQRGFVPFEELAEEINERFLLVDRDGQSVSLSGR